MRIVDPEAMRRARLRVDECAACGGPCHNLHHVVQKGSPHFGDDVWENVVGICGSGTSGCHGAIHGNPYVVDLTVWERWESERPRSLGSKALNERRDEEWVGRHIGIYLRLHRPDVIEYVLRKIGEEAGREFLRRFYYID